MVSPVKPAASQQQQQKKKREKEKEKKSKKSKTVPVAKHDPKKEMEKKARLQKLQDDLLKKMSSGINGQHGSIATPERKQGIAAETSERKKAKLNAGKHEGIASEKMSALDTAPTAAAGAQKLSAEWLSHYNKLIEFKKRFGDCNVPSVHPLCTWVDRQRESYKLGELSKEEVAKLNSIGFIWEAEVEEPKDVNNAREVILDEDAADAKEVEVTIDAQDTKEVRPRLSKSSIEIFKDWYLKHEDDPYPKKGDREELAAQTGLSTQQVNSWFWYERRKRGVTKGPQNLSQSAVDIFRKWYDEHESNPIPTKEEKLQMANATGYTVQQVNSWFCNQRNKRGDTKPDGRLPKDAVVLLKHWFDEHNDNPYTSKEQKKELMVQTGLSEKQVTNWFICERARRHDAAECSYSDEALAYLHDWYDTHESNPFPTKEEKTEIAAATELNEAQIDVWLESERVRRGNAKKTHRLPLSSIKVLKEWLELHEHHPYPNKEQKAALAASTGLSEQQVYNYFSCERYKKGGAVTNKRPHPQSSVAVLKDWFDSHEDSYPTKEQKLQLAAEAQLSEKQVDQWFLNERAQRKRAGCEIKGSRKRAKTTRTHNSHSEAITEVLHRWYSSNPFPTKEEKEQIEAETELTEQQIQRWFTHERAKRGDSLPNTDSDAVELFKKWYEEHLSHPYPSKEEIANMSSVTGRTEKQVWRWFNNERSNRKKAVLANLNKLGFDAPSDYLKNWFKEHESRCPTKDETAEISAITGLVIDEIDEWFERKVAKSKQKNSRLYPQKTYKYLKERYAANQYPSKEEQADIASVVKLDPNQVKAWFTAERARQKEAGAEGLRDRSDLSTSQSDYLKEWYSTNGPHPSNEEKKTISNIIGLTEDRINSWFSGYRTRQNQAAGITARNTFPEEALSRLRKWRSKNKSNQYPSKEEKEVLAQVTGLTVVQVSGWLANERSKHRKATGKAPPSQTDKLPKEAVEFLEDMYVSNPYPKKADRASIAAATGLNDSQIKSWLVRRRQRDCSNKDGKTGKNDSDSNAV